MRIYLLLILFLCLPLSAYSQHEADNWYFGDHAGISFKTGTPVALSDGQITPHGTGEGCASISDKTTGALLFYTDGVTVWNSNHQVMKNGTGLKGGYSSTQSALIVPNPANKLQFYVFTAPDLSPETGTTAMYYSMVSLETPGGEVLSKNTMLIDSIAEKLTGTLDCSGTGYWVVTHHRSKSEVYSFHVTASGVDLLPIVSTYQGEISNYKIGYMKISPNRTKLALASTTDGGYLCLFDFDAGTGKVTNYIVLYNSISSGVYTYGLSFSPDNAKLYSILRNGSNPKTEVVQYDLNIPNADSIRNSVTTIYTSASTAAWQLGPDGKIYIACINSPFLDVVENPNLKGIACNYKYHAIQLTNKSAFGLPNFMDYIFNQIHKDTIFICPKSSVQLGYAPVADITYSWTPIVGLDNPNVSNPIATPTQTTQYKVKTTNSGGCENYQIYVVKVNNIKAKIDTVLPLCSGSSIQLLASGGDSYEWSPTEGLDSATKANPIASPKVNTRYTVVVTRGDCKDTAYVDVNLFKANVSRDTVICGGSSVRLSASGGDTYLWSPATGLNNPRSATPIASPTVTTKYRVLVSNKDCIDSAFVTVTVKPFSGAKAGLDKTVCLGASTELGAPPEEGNTYLWQPPTNLDDATKANPTLTPTANGTTQYVLTVTSKNGCIAYDTVQVITGNISAKVSNDTAICTGSSVQLSASGGSDYEWSPSSGLDNPNIPNPIATPISNTTYRAKVSSGTCEDSAFVTITVNPFPIANAGPDLSTCKGETLQLGVSSQVGYTYQWQPPTGLDNPTKSNPNATPTVTTGYVLTVTNSAGCSSKDTVMVIVGNIKAIASNDTTICAGSSVRLSASGGTNYEWSPTTGLDNPYSANPLCTPNSTTDYKVVVTSGLCVDTVFVTVRITPPPIADAGQDKTICVGEQTIIGVPEIPGNVYSWTPTTGLSNPNAGLTGASPSESTTYILKVANQSGCVDEDTVQVSVTPTNERLFTLNPSTITILPGKPFETTLNIPVGVQSWKVHLDYDNLLLKFGSVQQMTNGISAASQDMNGQLYLNGNGDNGNVVLSFNTFLPQSLDTIFSIHLTIDSTDTKPCETVVTHGTTLQLGVFCGRNIRNISSTGKKFFLTSKENGINFGVGLAGNVRVELYDYTGILKEVLADGNLDAGEYSIEFDLNTGIYFCRMRAGLFEDVEKVITTE